jgi:hypothetical protein
MELIDKEILYKVNKSISNIAEIISEEKRDRLFENWAIIENLFLDNYHNYKWPMEKNEFEKNFGFDSEETVNTQIRQLRLRGNLIRGEGGDYFVEGPGGPRTTTYIYESGAKKILKKLQSVNGAKLLQKFGINVHLKKCFLFIIIIKYAVKGIEDPKQEFVITQPNFRIDLYLKKSKLAIECDEIGHTYESPIRRKSRQKAIEDKLNCRFLRFNPHDIDFDIGKILDRILRHILGLKINGDDPIDNWNKSHRVTELDIDLEQLD